MGNTKRTADDNISLLYIFDLKGSTVNRLTKAKDERKGLKNTTCLKDTNLINYKKTKPHFLKFNKESQEKLKDIILKDTDLLLGQKLMDYSLLFAVEYKEDELLK